VPTLRAQLTAYLEGWQFDLNAEWRAFFGSVKPDLSAVDPALQSYPDLPVIPGRKGEPLPGGPPGAHVFRAFDDITPGRVSVVVIGQDPYPRISRATGRAFEDGALTTWSGEVAVSLQRLMQSALADRLSRPEVARTPAGWQTIRQELNSGTITLEPLGQYFDRLQKTHGVLFVNAGWTLTRFASGGSPEQKGHIAMWQPLMMRLLNGLAERSNGRIVFMLLGGFAQRLFRVSGVEQKARDRGVWERSVAAVAHPHPNTLGPSGYLARGNPLAAVNSALAAMSGAKVRW
jgi:uracil-DNA glycosylase